MVSVVGERYVRLLKKYGYQWPPRSAFKGLEVHGLILVSLGQEELHDSGYPYIRVFGVGEGGVLYDLGVHDHVMFVMMKVRSLNIDSLGSNIFRVHLSEPVRVGQIIGSDSFYVDERLNAFL